ncbi:MAG: hypothetical protein K6E93_07610 [Bacteroidales bacterium]|nr:hypothetical protein [Bacteroidales bacterium]
MQEKTRKLITWICLGVAVLGAFFAILFALNQDKFSGMYNIAYGILLIFVVLALASILYFLVLRVINGGGKGLLIGLGLLVAVVLIAFLLSSKTDLSDTFLARNDASQGTSKLVGAGCITVYVLVFAAACSIIYVEIAKAIKKK